MKWVLIDEIHVNMDQVETFYWRDEMLVLHFYGSGRTCIIDPDRECYIKLCHVMGVRPYEEEV